MKAIVMNEYGSADVLTLKEVDKPAIKESEVLEVFKQRPSTQVISSP